MSSRPYTFFKSLSTALSAHSTWLANGLVVLLYAITHLPGLTQLPIFADEAIYIRWTQLIIDDPWRYAFFPLNDGKTPLHMWLMVPWQFVFSDQLFAARFVSVVVGLVQVFLVGYVVKILGGRRKTQYLSMILTTLLPFWYFHHRMALIDGLLTVWFSVMIIGAIKLSQLIPSSPHRSWSTSLISPLRSRPTQTWMAVIGLALGLALWTKLTALLFIPSLFLFVFLPTKLDWRQRCGLIIQIGLATLLGLTLFATMRLHPAFGQLFNRGSDFLYPWQDVILHGKWTQTLQSLPNYLSYFVSYATAPVVMLVAAGLFSTTKQRTHHVLFWSAVAFIGPIALLGRVVYPRYLFPALILITISAALMAEELIDTYINSHTQLAKKTLGTVFLVLFAANIFSTSFLFIFQSHYDADQLPLVSSDREQYLEEWSSGHGITQTVDLIKNQARTHTVAVATEGFFGTLPDALLVYFHRQNVDGIYIEGIGQPVNAIPAMFVTRAAHYDQTLLVVNSHRLQRLLPAQQLLAEFCRPNQAPCLQVWDITNLIKTPVTPSP